MILVYLILLPTLALASQVVISEIMYNPLGSDTGREWLEVKNVSTSTISLVDGTWRFNDGSSHLVATSSANTFLQPQEYGIIADDPTKFMLDNPSYSGVVYDSSFSLKNSDTKISIFKNGLEDDSVTYSISLGADDNGKTLEYDFGLSQWRSSYIVGGTPGAEASVKPANEPPVLQVTLVTQAEINKPVKFTAVVTDPENQPVQVKWQFGDDSGAEGVEVVHEYSNDGLYTIVASASDGEIIVYSTSTLKIVETPVSAQANNSVSGWAKVELSEILPNPSGSETDSEWIELFNNSPDTVSVDRWQIGDNTTRRFTLTTEKQNVQISPYGYLLISRAVSGVSLNNTGEQVTLYAPDGSVVDKVIYDKAVEDYSFIKINGAWQWTSSLTPGNLNILTVVEESNDSVDDNLESIVSPTTTKVTTVKNEVAKTTVALDKNVAEALAVTEIFPNPKGKDDNEWLELKNISSSTIDLLGYYIDDELAGSKPYYFSTSTPIKSAEYLILNKNLTKLSLGNSQDSVRLLDENKQVLWEVKYTGVKENESYAYDQENDDWRWTIILSPGKENLFLENFNDMNITGQTINEPVEEFADESDQVQSVSGALILPDKTNTILEGVVIIAPHVYAKNIFYVAEYDQETKQINPEVVIQVYSTKGEFNDIKIGDVIQVVGSLATSKNERRFKILTNEVPVVFDTLQDILLEETAITEIENLDTGSLVKITGKIVEKKSTNLVIENGDATIKVAIKKASNISLKDYAVGDWLTVIGIVDQQNTAGLRIIPRQISDLSKVVVAGETEVASSTANELNKKEITLAEVDRRAKIKKIIIEVIVCLTVLIFWEIYRWYKKNKKI